MLYAYAFGRVGVVMSDLYFVDPDPGPGQEGPERGVRVEVRLFERTERPGSIYAAQAIAVEQPIWRADLLESVETVPGSFDRTHHHPGFVGWEPGRRRFEKELSADPVQYVGRRLGDLDGLVAGAQLDADVVAPGDAAELRASVPEILETLTRLLARVHRGELALAPAAGPSDSERIGWL